jgi:hypothetical protein
VLWARFAAATASRVHGRAVRRMLRAPMSFFDTNPIGRCVAQ